MLLGEHDHSLDEKNRLTLPARLRGAFEDGVVVTFGLDGCLEAYPRARWDDVAGRIQALDPLSADSRLLKRHVFAGAAQGDLDRQGRLVVPARLIERVGLGREVTVIGVHDHLEIWDRTAWREKQHEIEGRAEDVAERLANRD
ncbi:MAG TPA: division/cell wall cluster transcriptional repressor MraZ [Gaiellaceae bacterium]|nr:division/cell wall cluster transcriptional repressor MraZ [Gaiellaceae bacterium]